MLQHMSQVRSDRCLSRMESDCNLLLLAWHALTQLLCRLPVLNPLTVLSALPVARMLGFMGLKAKQLTSAMCASLDIIRSAARCDVTCKCNVRHRHLCQSTL
jgi:hypothetical protein